MSQLTQENIAFITQTINKTNIESTQLKEDLIDHFCCAVEEGMEKGKSFEKSYDKAYHNICPEGFDEIQQGTAFLLTIKKNKTMKKALYLSGYLTAIGYSLSIIMKILHLQGASIVLLLSSLLLILFFLPMLFINLYKRDMSKILSEKLKYVFGFIGLALLLVSLTFKSFHWPGANIMFVVSIGIINFIVLPLLFFKMYRKSGY